MAKQLSIKSLSDLIDKMLNDSDTINQSIKDSDERIINTITDSDIRAHTLLLTMNLQELLSQFYMQHVACLPPNGFAEVCDKSFAVMIARFLLAKEAQANADNPPTSQGCSPANQGGDTDQPKPKRGNKKGR